MRGLRTAGLSLVVALIGIAQVAYSHEPEPQKPTIAQVIVILAAAGALLLRHRHPRTVAVVAALAVGDAVRNRRALLRQERRRTMEAEHTRQAEAHRQVREERIRIARDLHDVVAHPITLVNAQAGVAHHLLRIDDEPEPLQPVPSFAELDRLLDSFRDGGLQVQLTRHGTPSPLTGLADLAAYRIVQEALTNAHKHGTAPHAALDLAYTERTLEITVTNPAEPGHNGPGTGHGTIGMRERAESAGGRFTATLQPDRNFVVHAHLPLDATPAPAP